jgi:beta-glucosidase
MAVPQAATVDSRPEEEGLYFPEGFLWGAATSAYQIEGATHADGRGASIWDTFSSTPGKVFNGDTGQIATDHYHRYGDDVALMKDIGLKAYRFSVSWPRIQPDGTGAVNNRGLDFYHRLVDCLLEYGIEPWVTLYHWDLPQALQDRGGWAARDTAYRFAEYAEHVHAALADRVRYWTTLNEPQCVAFYGHASGTSAPGLADATTALCAIHHLLLGHGLALQALRAGARNGNEFGITLNLVPSAPASSAEYDVDAARRIDGLQNRIFLDPLLRGAYPADVLTDLERIVDLSCIKQGDERLIAQPMDLLGINYYLRWVVSGNSAARGPHPSPWTGSEHVTFVPGGGPTTAMGWEVDSSGLVDTLTRVAADYPPIPLYITENGAAYEDIVTEDGQIHDVDRLRYLKMHFCAAHQAIARGVDLRGYFVWSLLDNFEWTHGYSKRFGLVHVDYRTLRRTLKDSALWYRDIIKHNGLCCSEVASL